MPPADSSSASSASRPTARRSGSIPATGSRRSLMPSTGGAPRPFLPAGTNTPAWSPDGSRLVYIDKANRDDPIYVADRFGADARQIFGPGPLKNMNPVWSPDSQWIYFARGSEPQDETEMDVWRLRPDGGSPERVTTQHLAINFLAPLDRAHAALRGARGGPVGTVAVVARRRQRRVDASAVGRRSIHVGLGQPRRPAHRRHRRQSEREPVAGAAARSTRRGTRRGALRAAGADGHGAGPALWQGRRCSICPRAGLATASGKSRTGKRPKSDEAWTGRCPNRRRSRRRTTGRRRDGERGNGTCRSCRRTARTREPWPRPSRSRAPPARAPPTGRRTAPGS